MIPELQRASMVVWPRRTFAGSRGWKNFQRALSTLQRAIALSRSRPLSELEEQGLIQAFQFTHELSWLLIRDFLMDQGVAGISGSRDAAVAAAG